MQHQPNSAAAAHAVAEIYHDWMTGLVLALVAHAGADTAEEFVFRLFRRQHLERFLPGLAKLELDRLPHAVAAARYHYFSNQLGGVKVEYFEESDRKAWVRYPPPRWIWRGTAICAIPSAVNRAMLRGWHAHNGVSLGNPRLGFVCTGTTVDGQPGLEGYYIEHDDALAPDERLRFVDDEVCPWIDPDSLPRLAAESWPAERKAKAYRNYATEYVRNALPLLVELLGGDRARTLGARCARQIGMHCYAGAADALGLRANGDSDFLDLMEALLIAAGDRVSRQDATLVRHRWRLFDAMAVRPQVIDIWLALFEGLLAAHNRQLRLGASGANRFWVHRA